MSSKVSILKSRPELGQKTSMQQQDDAVDKNGTNTDLFSESQQFFKSPVAAFPSLTSRVESSSDSQAQTTAHSARLNAIELSEPFLDLKAPYYTYFPFNWNFNELVYNLNCPKRERENLQLHFALRLQKQIKNQNTGQSDHIKCCKCTANSY